MITGPREVGRKKQERLGVTYDLWLCSVDSGNMMLGQEDMPMMLGDREASDAEVERYRGQSGERSSPRHRHVSRKVQAATGMGMAGLILLIMTYVLLGFVGGWGLPLGWMILFSGIVFACGLATPTTLRLLWPSFSGLRKLEPDRRRSLSFGKSTTVPATMIHAERQLLEAIDRRGEITPARAALETTLTVAEADRLLSDLAQRGHLEVRAEGGKLVYSL